MTTLGRYDHSGSTSPRADQRASDMVSIGHLLPLPDRAAQCPECWGDNVAPCDQTGLIPRARSSDATEIEQARYTPAPRYRLAFPGHKRPFQQAKMQSAPNFASRPGTRKITARQSRIKLNFPRLRRRTWTSGDDRPPAMWTSVTRSTVCWAL